MVDENLIATLEQSLRQTKAAQNRLITRLNEVEAEADRLKEEIEALQNSAVQTEAAIYSLLATMGAGKISWNQSSKPRTENDYEIPQETRRHYIRQNPMPREPNQPQNQPLPNQPPQYQQSQQQQQQYQPPPRNNQANNNQANNYPPNNYQQNNSIAYLNQQRNIPNINQNLEVISNRFVDRTITQACTLLLKEVGKSLHVNELYHLLVSGGMEFKGNNPTISIAVSLNRNRRFRKVAPGTFDLVMRDASQATG